MDLAKFDKSLGNGRINFSAVMEVEARIFTTPVGKKSYLTTKTSATQKTASTNPTANNPNK